MEISQLEQRICEQLRDLSAFTATPGAGVTRFPFTAEARQASEYLRRRMSDIGLQVHMDNSGSIIGRMAGQVSETLMIGSHLDSVYKGGEYDGIAGVVSAIETLRLLVEAGYKPYYSLEVIATNDEEGSRFKSGLFTGKVLSGQLSPADIRNYKDDDGISVYDAMAEYGLQPEEIAKHPRNDIKAFLEIHIEQGPVLENAGKDIGIVDNIVGIKRVMVTIRGRADHVGTMPMNMRKDALEAAAKVIADIGDVARKYPQAVATVGHLTVEPNIVNIIPDKVCFTVDFRGTTPTVIEAQYQELLTNLRNITARFGMDFDVLNTVDAAPVEMSAKFRDFVEASCIANRYSYMHLASGAGHDAGIFGTRMPAGMIFVPSMGGRSHCPEEKTDSRTLAMASLVAWDVLCKMDRERAL